MLLKREDCQLRVIPEMKGGKGEFELTHILGHEELLHKGRLFGRGVLKPGCSVGLHSHKEDFEVCYFLKGNGYVREAGSLRQVEPGDCTVTAYGDSHEIINTGTEDLEYMVLVLYQDGCEN